MKAVLHTLVLLMALTGSLPADAASRDLTVDLSEKVVQITADFDGSELLLFGAADTKADIVVIVRGPFHDAQVRRKERVMGVWANGAEVTFKNVPSYYFLASNRPFEEFVPQEIASERQIGYQDMELTPKDETLAASLDRASLNAFHQALIRVKQQQGLYGTRAGHVNFVGDKLFRTTLRFPNNIPVGQYSVDVFMFQDGRIVDESTTLLGVRKFGVEAQVYDFAHNYALLYGILAIIMAGVAGWLANTLFRKG